MRESGILMHITSLPSPYGIGTMGSCAYEFVDFLEKSGQTYWQLLPLNPTGHGNSPYQSFTSHGGNPYLIDLEQLIAEGLLKEEEVSSVFWGENDSRVDFAIMYSQRLCVLRKAFGRFQENDDYSKFVKENSSWLEDYSLFTVLKESLEGIWPEWDRDLMLHKPEAVAQKKEEYKGEIEFHKFLQFKFFEQWHALRSYANNKGIKIIGDIPIYVPFDSADVWANQELFQLDENSVPSAVAGCPPDGFSADGQLWGNPLYNWEILKQNGYSWWIDRIAAAADMYDVIRIDHFRGLESYWAVPAGAENARGGKWVKGPGTDFTNAIRQTFPNLKFIAEDLGYITPEVKELQKSFGHPGMKVIEFAFDSRESSEYLPHLYPLESVCYTGTHDNPPLKQWLEEISAQDLGYAKAYLGLNDQEGYISGMLRAGMSSVSRIFIAQIQDYLELGKESRMNLPGTLSDDNWTWRASGDYLNLQLSQRIYSMTKLYGRLK